MHTLDRTPITFAFLALLVFAGALRNLAIAHEGHQMECSESNINSVKADIQTMPDGKSKTTAIKEMQAAQDLMQKKDAKGCMAHLHNAMDAVEK